MVMFGWCMENQHDKCIRKFKSFTIDPKTSKVVWSGEQTVCQCAKRGCPCYVPKSKRK